MLTKTEKLLEEILKELKILNSPNRKKPVNVGLDKTDMILFDMLRDNRYQWAKEERVPPYVVASNVTLAAIAYDKPLNLLELSEVKGVGKKTVERYGEGLLSVIRRFTEEQL